MAQDILVGRNESTSLQHFDRIVRTPIATVRDATELLQPASVRNADSVLQQASCQSSLSVQPRIDPVVTTGSSSLKTGLFLLYVVSAISVSVKAVVDRLRKR